MKKLIALLLLVPMVGFGIEPVIFTLDETKPTYTVPANKVLVIEAIAAGNGYGVMVVNLIIGGITNECSFIPNIGGVTGGVTPLSRSVKIPGGTVITPATIASDIIYVFFGLLVDQSDLYVYIDHDAGDMLVQDGVFSFDIHAATPRPARVSVEGSMDLLTPWQPVDASVKKKSPDSYTVSIPMEDEEKYFAKYHLRGIDP
jgi:hypothetical protein